jgi:putative ABC transport system permease protein
VQVKLAELFREASRAIRAHRLRSALTLLGIIIGVATLVGVVAVISGLNAFVRDRVFDLAPDVFVLTRFGIIRTRDEFLDALKRRNIEWNDYARLADQLSLAESVAAQVTGTSAVKYRERRLPDMRVFGTTANFGAMMRLDVTAGRYFSAAEDRTAQALAVIGWDIKDELFPQLDPIGREILVGGVPYRVVGLIAKQGRTLGENRDSRLYLPIQAYRRQFGLRDSLDLLIQARGGVLGLEAAIDEARAVLRALRHTDFRAPDPFGLVTAEALQTLWAQISAAAFILTLLIASVSLGIGGIVIMNIMLVAVAERTREIGIRLAIGARKRDIRRQFLLEAALLSASGGLVGVALGTLLALGVKDWLGFPAEMSLPIAALGLSLAVVVGLVAGYWPARSASNLLLVDALRAE